jgi:hypothetical protein
MSLTNLIVSSVAKAKVTLGDLVVTFKVRKKSGTEYVNGKYENTYTDTDVDGIYDKFQVHEIDGNLIKSKDVKLLLFVGLVLPENGDLLVDETGLITYNVISSVHTKAGSTPVVSTVQVRK